MPSKNPEKLSARNLWGFALGAIPTGLLGYIFGLKYVEFFYNDLAMLPAFFIIGQLIYGFVNAINDPLLGQMSDRTNRQRWGSRRLIFMRYGGPLWALTFLLVWFPWSLDNQIIIFLHFVVSLCLFDTFYTLVVLVWLALLPEMTTDIDERNKAQFIATLLGTVVVMPIFLILANIAPSSFDFRMIMIILAVVSTGFVLLTAFMCKEKPEFRRDPPYTLWNSVKATFTSKTFLIYVGFYFCQNLLSSLGLSYIFVYLLLLQRITPGVMTLLFFFLIYFIVAYVGNIVCMRLRPKWGLRGTILKFGAIRVVSSLVLFLLILVPVLEPLVWIGLILSTFFAGYGIFYIPMQYLAIDEDEVRHGSRREGMFIGVMALLTKPANSLGPIIATVVLGAYGYIQGGALGVQPESAFLGIKILFLLVPAVVAAISLIFICYYPLHGRQLADMQQKLANLHEKKKAALARA
jgi:GPH family glycoside/pentoside/hexuronide:cation symporter